MLKQRKTLFAFHQDIKQGRLGSPLTQHCRGDEAELDCNLGSDLTAISKKEAPHLCRRAVRLPSLVNGTVFLNANKKVKNFYSGMSSSIVVTRKGYGLPFMIHRRALPIALLQYNSSSWDVIIVPNYAWTMINV